jgi:hypothetical protein
LLEYFKFSGGNIGEKVTMFFTTFSSQNPSEKFETKFMTFFSEINTNISCKFWAENDSEKGKTFFITIFTWNKSVKGVNNLLEKMV